MKGSRWITDPDYTPRTSEDRRRGGHTDVGGGGVRRGAKRSLPDVDPERFLVVVGYARWLGLTMGDYLNGIYGADWAPEYIEVMLNSPDLVQYLSRKTAEMGRDRYLEANPDIDPRSVWVESGKAALAYWKSMGRCEPTSPTEHATEDPNNTNTQKETVNE